MKRRIWITQYKGKTPVGWSWLTVKGDLDMDRHFDEVMDLMAASGVAQPDWDHLVVQGGGQRKTRKRVAA